MVHVKWVPCHHSVVHPHVVDGGDGIQVWRTAADILNNQSGTSNKGLSSSLRIVRDVDGGQQFFTIIIQHVTYCLRVGFIKSQGIY
jgi:hypothetical protein